MGVRRHGQSMPLGKGEEEKEKASFSSSSFDTPTTGNRREMEREAAGWPSRTGYGRNITINPWGHYDTNNLHAWARIRRRKRHSSPPHPSLLQPRRRSGATTLSLGLRTLRRRTMPRRRTHNNQSVGRGGVNNVHAWLRMTRRRRRHPSPPHLLILQPPQEKRS